MRRIQRDPWSSRRMLWRPVAWGRGLRAGVAASRARCTGAALRAYAGGARGAARAGPTRDVLRVDELPEAASAPPVDREPDESKKWPPLAQCVLENMRAFPHCMLLTRVGGFYESYFDQAPVLAESIGIKLASRKWAGETVPMAGFPLLQLDKYLKTLVQDKGFLVAICEEFKTSGDEGQPLQRRVSRVVSAGTLIDERFLDPFNNNFILAVQRDADGTYGLAWLDVSTADFQTALCEDDRALRDTIVRIEPREVVLVNTQFSQDTDADAAHPIWEALSLVPTTVSSVEAPDDAPRVHVPGPHSDALRGAARSAERAANVILTSYLQTRLLDHMAGMQLDTAGADAPARATDTMQLDAHTLAALEIRESALGGGSVRGSLASILRRTVTHGGTRLFAHWLTLPSTSRALIEGRHAVVALFLERPFLRQDVRSQLRAGAGDVLRTLQRISLRRNDEQDLLEIRDFVRTSDTLLARLCDEESARSVRAQDAGWAALRDITGKFRSLHALGERLGHAIDERVIEKRIARQEALHSKAGGLDVPRGTARLGAGRGAERTDEGLWGDDFEHLVRPSSSPVLAALTDEYNALRRQARGLETALRAELTDAVSLRFLQGQGHVVHCATARGMPDDAGLALAYKTKTTRTYYHPDWTKLGTKLQRVAARLADREAQTLERLRQEVLEETAALRRNARLLDQLDVLLGFSQAAEELALVQPVMDETTTMDIRGARHLGVEMGLLERHRLFTKNDLQIGAAARMHLITGPNMGGKSTYLRQNALIAVLAQAGSFVPADAARLGIVDRIFSRVGAKDDLFHSRSTFMVEMMETADILRRATPRSFVIADEIGRGTNTTVGAAIAFATLHALAVDIGCRSLFATHYYELVDLLNAHGARTRGAASPAQRLHPLHAAVAFYCTTLDKDEHTLRFSHRIRPGINRESHGLEIARLADMPEETVALAERTHQWLEEQGGGCARAQGSLLDDVLTAVYPNNIPAGALPKTDDQLGGS
ncbi:hypothetical protein MSPP1_000248 [Malassezia sp. CBS 17886]|nr:hypothetical protein MSPP1_000248 [Malassezia sp. CBS 17886]